MITNLVPSGNNGSDFGCNSVAGSCLGALFGPILIVIAVIVLSWNEGNAVKVEIGLNQGSASVMTINASQPSPQSNGKLVYVTGLATADRRLHDPIFHIQAQGLALTRNVSMYQWDEEEQSTDENGHNIETYTYSREWSSSEILSSNFNYQNNHKNPQMSLQSKRFTTGVHCGRLIVGQSLIDQLGTELVVRSVVL